ncbi:alanine--tRNA ligase [Butyrivibrio sp. AE2032]|uniref:alanine--tRNA ligase n=1 Tax=Butyrivibrio sp. AE2032 TaxID=1458463 RepID=UPI0005504184|nr:alanine--tRNA ligase [Butyrivibrio sp. AE2032]
MRQFTSKELRKTWKEFYIERGHVDVGAVSLVSDGSTGVLFNVAGMQPLMPFLLGEKHPLGTRLCNVQGCVRTNDIDSVGDRSHVTFFEMMGSWSLGDYFKEERCKWSYELLTGVFGFDKDHLAATVFAGDENAPRDEEGAQFRIASGFKPENIYYLGADDNWWGLEYGPCGPDSEMFYIADVPDCGPNCGPGCSCGKYTEIGNDVFMQYEKHQDGTLTPLKQKNVDTGWGLERILAFLNGTKDVYKTDLFTDAIAFIEKSSGVKYDSDEKLTRSMRVLADHIRTSVMLIGDAAKLVPSNAGAGYVLRRLIRRAVRHARTLGMSTEQILDLAKIYIDSVYDDSYPLLAKNREFILNELDKEIARFESTLENGIKEFKKILDDKKAAGSSEIDGESAFYLYDTFGFPIELTVEMASEEGLKVDEEGFKAAMEKQKETARAATKAKGDLALSVNEIPDEVAKDSNATEYDGYDNLKCDAKVIYILKSDEEGVKVVDSASEGDDIILVTDKTVLYATMGGQIHDEGKISTAGFEADVISVDKDAQGKYLHTLKVVKGTVSTGGTVSIEVDKKNRLAIARNHTATHILLSALQKILGDHVEQAGSYVGNDRLRFDFNNSQAMTAEEIAKVEEMVNDVVLQALPVETKVLAIEDAKKLGATAIFGEKYGEVVRVVAVGGFEAPFDLEFCGGTHLTNSAQIGQFRIVSESGIAAGIRRIEAVTGERCYEMNKADRTLIDEATTALKTPKDKIVERIDALHAEVKSLEKELAEIEKAKAGSFADSAVSGAKDIGGVKAVIAACDAADAAAMRDTADKIRDKLDCGVVFLAANGGDKLLFTAMATKSAVDKGAHCGNIIKEAAKVCGGGGGGRPDMAQAGGKDVSKLADALAKAEEVLASQVNG